LPQPEPQFKGKIGRIVKDSVPDLPKGVEAPAGAPDDLLILTDPIETQNFLHAGIPASICGMRKLSAGPRSSAASIRVA